MASRAELLRIASLVVGLSGCAGGVPLMHPAHVLRPGEVSFGAGVSGQFKAEPEQTTAQKTPDTAATLLDNLAVAPGVAPWISGRVGIVHDFEGGITYTGRELRIDGRHAFPLGPLKLSVGLGGTALVPRPLPGDAGSVSGGGADLPVLLGWSSTADLYAIWFGPRGGFEILTGHVLVDQLDPSAPDTEVANVSGKHFYVGGVAGFRVGFRYFHAALELNVEYHAAMGSFGAEDVTAHNVSVVPAGAMALSF